jgi:hypothetical protein
MMTTVKTLKAFGETASLNSSDWRMKNLKAPIDWNDAVVDTPQSAD